MLLLAAYRNGERKHRSKVKSKEPIWLPEPSWFQERLRSCNLDGTLAEITSSAARAGARVSAEGLQVQALVTLRPGVVWKGLVTPFNEEERLLWLYNEKPCSAFSVQVKDFFVANTCDCVAEKIQWWGHCANHTAVPLLLSSSESSK